MKRVMWFGLLGMALIIGAGCQDEVKSIQQKEQVHESEPQMQPPEMVVEPEQLPPAGRMPPVPKGVRASDALMARRAAEMDAYRKLAEEIKGLRIDSRTYVKDFITESDVIRADTVAHIRGVRVTRIDFPPDSGICEVEAMVGLSQVITYLKELHTRDIKGDNIKALDYNTMRQVNKKTIVTATGQGAIRGR
ncbi:MAG: hypothetical protein JXQ73_16285 [Phycisphaerae bacterium]|nr:hypothetical protein [Phycisphaerae bacterium]